MTAGRGRGQVSEMIEWWWVVLAFGFGIIVGAQLMILSLKHFGFLDKDY